MGSKYMVPFEDIKTDRFENYRWDMGKIEDLMGSIDRVGLQNPLKVRARRVEEGESSKTYYDLIDGRRRYTAIQRLRAKDPKRFEEVQVVLFEGNELDACFAMWELNEQAKPHSPIETADWIRMMVTKREQKLVDVAERISISQSWASRLLKVRNQCHNSVLVAINKGVIPFSLAEEWVDFPEEKQLAHLRKFTEVKEATGSKKKAGAAAGKKKVLSWKAINIIHEAAKKVAGDYYKGYADCAATVLNKGPVPEKVKDVIKKQLAESEAPKKAPRAKKAKKAKSKPASG